MTLPHLPDPEFGNAAAVDAIETVIVPRSRDLGGFSVRRALPAAQRQMVGPFIFLDQLGPVLMPAGQGVDVRPHPHVGLATVTWLFDGAIHHRDSLGSSQSIVPGALNWMTAGRGIVHSERTAAAELAHARQVFGLQSWVALPAALEEMAPSFEHLGQQSLPLLEDRGRQVRVIAGELFGACSPVKLASDLFYAEVILDEGQALSVPAIHVERAVYTVDGLISISDDEHGAGRLLVLRSGEAVTVRALRRCRFMILGGEPMEGPRYIWWNFVSSSRERINQAKEDWRRGRFGIVPGDETDFIHLPD